MTLNLYREAKAGVQWQHWIFDLLVDLIKRDCINPLWVISSDITWYGEGLHHCLGNAANPVASVPFRGTPS